MEDPRGARAFRLEAIVREETDAGAAAAVSALADDGALAVVGPLLSGAAEKALPAAASRSLAVVSPTASSARLEGASPVFFRTCMTMEDFSSALAGFAAARLGTPRVAMLVPAEPYGRSFADAFRRAVAGGGGRVVASVEYAPALTDVAARAAELDALLRPGGAPSPRETGADALFFAGGPKDAALLLGQLSRRGLEVRSLAVVGGSAFDTPELPRLAGLLAEGALFADGFFPGSERPEARDFVERYRARFGAEPGAAAAQACAAVELLAEALRGGAATREEVLSRLSGLGRVRTVLGPVRSSPGGRVERRPFFGTVSGGRLVELPERGQGTE
jgi:branched-chain amino acid transport system substrate-binding protein